jgi:hypothetical protein
MKMRTSSYTINGIAKDQNWIVANRAWLEEEMLKHMRENGYIPILDANIELYWEYNKEDDTFSYKMVAKGRRVGPKRSKKVLGYLMSEGVLLGLDGKSAAKA